MARAGREAGRVRRKAVLLAATVALISLLGVFMHAPPSLIDAIAGATPKPAVPAAAPRNYVLAVNQQAAGADTIMRRINGAASAEPLRVGLYAVNDGFTAQRAERLSEQLLQSGIETTVRLCSETMLFSRAVAGEYELLLYPEGTDAPDLSDGALVIIPDRVPGE
jgi:hypothetical protein